MLSSAKQNTENSLQTREKSEWKTRGGLRPLGFSTWIFLSFVVNIYGSVSQISAYCSKLPSLYDTCPICLPMAPLLKYQYLGGKYDVLL